MPPLHKMKSRYLVQMEQRQLDQRSNWSLVYLILAFTISFFTLAFIIHGYNEASVRLNIRWSAKFSIVCFCLAFAASSANTIFKNKFTNWLTSNRRYLGVSFALNHLIHLLFLFLLERDFHPVFTENSALTLSLGGLAYVFLSLMLLTSFGKSSNLLSRKNWTRLHTIGGYWILIVFSNSMLGRLFDGKLAYIPLGLLVASTWLLRFTSLKSRS